MKINYEQKYKDALERAKSKIKNDKDHVLYENDVTEIFPELKETEDRKIRNAIYDALKYLEREHSWDFLGDVDILDAYTWLEKQRDKDDQVILPQFTFDDILALQCCMETVKKVQEDKELYEQLQSLHDRLHDAYWLEKQSDVDNADKVEPKFKVGDWVVNQFGDSWHIDSFDKKNYQVSDGKGNYNYFSILHQDEMRLWSIEDAKDGDVLCTYECSVPKIVFILKGTPKKYYALSYYCSHNIMHPYFYVKYGREAGCLAPNEEDVKPATKEQCDLLFTKIKEAGYEWDKDKKEIINTL